MAGDYRILHNAAPSMLPDSILSSALLVGIALAFFALACALHIAVWRMVTVTPSGATLIVLLTTAVVVQSFAVALVRGPSGDLVVATVLALEIAACYAISYPAMQARSPSLEMARQLQAAGDAGLARAELYARLDEHSLVGERIDDLVSDGLVLKDEKRFSCSARGVLLAHVFGAWKSLLREPKGG